MKNKRINPSHEVIYLLSKKKRDKISETLIRTAVTNWDKCKENFSFELRGEICKVGNEPYTADEWFK